jgi:hypothetical protein
MLDEREHDEGVTSEQRAEYATVADTLGCDYREIADTLTVCGWPMNHSSARNYVLRGIEKIAVRVLDACGLDSSHASARAVARSAQFQAGLAEVLRVIEDEDQLPTDEAEELTA